MRDATSQTNALTDPDPFPNRPTPDWYMNAKFGIFIHWGPAAVPAWAFRTTLNTQQMIKTKGLTYYFAHNPYSIWYFNTMRIPGSPTQEHHQKCWNNQPYEVFGTLFNEQSAATNHEYFKDWAEVFHHAGARYVVPVAKHHDGFTLWPTKVPPRKTNWSATVDLIGKLREQVIARDMRMGVYYSGMYDWSWNAVGIRNGFTAAINGYQSRDSVAYMDAHVRDLIERYQPDVLWNDIGYLTHPNCLPKNSTAFKSQADLWGYYYDSVPDGAIDDRWYEVPARSWLSYGLFSCTSRYFARPSSIWLSSGIDAILKKLNPNYDKPPGGLTFPPPAHSDFRTFEYDVPADIQTNKWELVRGIGLAFCYNRNEDPSQWLTFPELVRMFVDVVSKNGNLLLNVGPKADGSLQDHERKLLRDFGDWMKTYGDALYNTTPWSAIAKDTYVTFDTSDVAGLLNIRFTVRHDTLNLFFKAPAGAKEILIPQVQPVDSAIAIIWLPKGERSRLIWRKDNAGMWLMLPTDLPDSPLQCVSIDPTPIWSR
jgi:alpha-L-fucosidase